MMATGSVRGKCSVLQAVHFRTWPPRPCSVGPPHRPQNRCRRCQSTWALLWARMPTSWGVSCPAAARASTKLQGSSRFSSRSGSESAETSTAKWAAPSMRPRKTGGPSRPSLSMSAGSTHPSSALEPFRNRRSSCHSGRKRERGSRAACLSQSSSRRCTSPRSRGLPEKTCVVMLESPVSCNIQIGICMLRDTSSIRVPRCAATTIPPLAGEPRG